MTARVLWLTKGLGLGGAERLLTLTAPRVDRSRYTVEVAYLLPWKDAFVGELERHGTPAICLAAGRTVDPRWVGRLRRLLRDRRYDLVHTHSPVPAMAARLLVDRRRVALVHTEHNMWGRYRWPTYAGNAATYGRNDRVIAVSDGVASSIARPWWARFAGAPPVETLLHGVDVEAVPHGPEARAHARTRLGVAAEAPVVGTVANFTPKKDHAGLLAAVDELRHAVPDLLVLLVGSGPLEDDLRAQAQQRGLDRHVRFLGSRDDVLELLPALDVFVLASRFEGLPISLLEAMAAGVACVATAVGGIPEAIEHERHGLLVPPGRPSELAATLRIVLGDAGLRESLGAAAGDRVRERFSISRAAKRIEAVYDEVLSVQEVSASRRR